MTILFLTVLAIFFYITFQQRQLSSKSYVACGCGCCGGGKPNTQCLYHSKGDDLNKIIAQDKQARHSDICSVAGCSLGTEYRYCD